MSALQVENGKNILLRGYQTLKISSHHPMGGRRVEDYLEQTSTTPGKKKHQKKQ